MRAAAKWKCIYDNQMASHDDGAEWSEVKWKEGRESEVYIEESKEKVHFSEPYGILMFIDFSPLV